jgi:Flp pilus assembly protein TadD
MFLGGVQICTNRAAFGIAECERALEINRNLAEAHALVGWAKIFIGRAAETEAHVQEALRLSPRDSGAYRWLHELGIAKLMLGADVEAVELLRRSLECNRNNPIVYFQLGAALVLLQKTVEASAAIQEGLTLDPKFTIRRMGRMSDHPVFRAGSKRIRDAMRTAGVPEG